MFAQENSNVANEGNICYYTSNDVFPLDVILPAGVEFRVVCYVVVAFCQELGFVSISHMLAKISTSNLFSLLAQCLNFQLQLIQGGTLEL
jgi:hypothetical protein